VPHFRDKYFTQSRFFNVELRHVLTRLDIVENGLSDVFMRDLDDDAVGVFNDAFYAFDRFQVLDVDVSDDVDVLLLEIVLDGFKTSCDDGMSLFQDDDFLKKDST